MVEGAFAAGAGTAVGVTGLGAIGAVIAIGFAGAAMAGAAAAGVDGFLRQPLMKVLYCDLGRPFW